MTATVLLLHGWGFDASLWDRLRAHLPGTAMVRWDRGYFGPPAQTPFGGSIVAVGHSLGALLLATWLPAHVPLVAINGFDRFSGPGAVPARVTARMRMRFATAPAAVLDEFRSRCGAPPAPSTIDAAALSADLDRLVDMQAPTTGRPLLLLHGEGDPILPTDMRGATFPGAPRETLAEGGHLLPLTHPGWCAERIARLL